MLSKKLLNLETIEAQGTSFFSNRGSHRHPVASCGCTRTASSNGVSKKLLDSSKGFITQLHNLDPLPSAFGYTAMDRTNRLYPLEEAPGYRFSACRLPDILPGLIDVAIAILLGPLTSCYQGQSTFERLSVPITGLDDKLAAEINEAIGGIFS